MLSSFVGESLTRISGYKLTTYPHSEYLRQMAKHRQQAEARARFIRLHPHARPGFILSGIPPWLLL